MQAPGRDADLRNHSLVARSAGLKPYFRASSIRVIVGRAQTAVPSADSVAICWIGPGFW